MKTAGAALATLLAVASCSPSGRPQRPRSGFLFDRIDVAGSTYRFALYVPRDYDPGRPWPLILFLHGSGESGSDGSKQIAQGLGPAIQTDAARWPFLVLFPQKPGQDTEWEQHETAVMAILARVRAEYAVDAGRLYLTGMSQGGHGTWVLGARHPELWAALAPVCGYVSARREGDVAGLSPPFEGTAEELAAPLRAMPVWAFHGGRDDVVPPDETRRLVAALEAVGGRPRVTIFPQANHNSWDSAYRDSDLPSWLLAQHRPVAQPRD